MPPLSQERRQRRLARASRRRRWWAVSPMLLNEHRSGLGDPLRWGDMSSWAPYPWPSVFLRRARRPSQSRMQSPLTKEPPLTPSDANVLRRPSLPPQNTASVLQRGRASHPDAGTVLSALKRRELGGSLPALPQHNNVPQSDILRALSADRVPRLLQEQQLPSLRAFNKFFCSAWLDGRTVIAGSKCNQLVVWDVSQSTFLRLALPPGPWRERPALHCGMHALAVNPSRTLVACGGDNPHDIVVLSIPDFRPVAWLQQHTDWVFGVDWLSDTALVSGGRDGMLGRWNIESCLQTDAAYGAFSPMRPDPFAGRVADASLFVAHSPTRRRVRDVRYNPDLGWYASVSQDGFIRFWDAEMGKLTGGVELECTDPICITTSSYHNLFAVGASGYATFVDPRCHDSLTVRAVDDESSIRSIAFNNHVASMGIGTGAMMFYDVRMRSFLDLNATPGKAATRKLAYQTGDGWIDELPDTAFLPRESVRQVPYTHCYDPSGTRMFVAGGPLQMILTGCYAAVW